MKRDKYHHGFTGCYIQDHNFKHLCAIPATVAVAFVQALCPDVHMSSHVLAKDLTIGKDRDTDAIGNGWTNKLFILVANDHDKWIAIVNWDGRFSIYEEVVK